MALHLPASAERSPGPVRFIGLGLCLCFVAFYFWHHPPASLLLLMVAAILAYLRLEIALALLPLTFPYYEFLQPLSPSGYPGFSLAELGLIICLVVVLVRHLVRAEERQATQEWLRQLWRQTRPFLPPLLLFLFGASLGLLVTPELHVSLRAYRELIVDPLLYFLLILRYLRTRVDLARAIGALILSALVVACLCIAQGLVHVTSFAGFLDATKLRVNGPTDGPNNVAFQMDRVIPLLIALAFLGLWRRRRAESPASHQPGWRDQLRWVCLVLLIPLVWALYWTDSHGAELAILVVVFCFFVYEVRNWLVAVAIAGAALLGVGLFWSRLASFLSERGHGTVFERLIIWKAGLLIIRDHFLLGTGLATFNTYYRPSAPHSYLLQALVGQTGGAPNANLSHPHNFILDFWISTGLLGVVGLFWLLGAFAVVVVRTSRRCASLQQGPLLQRLVLGIAGCMLASVVHGLVDNMYFLPDLALTFWFFIGLLLVVRALVQQETASLDNESKKQDEEIVAA